MSIASYESRQCGIGLAAPSWELSESLKGIEILPAMPEIYGQYISAGDRPACVVPGERSDCCRRAKQNLFNMIREEREH